MLCLKSVGAAVADFQTTGSGRVKPLKGAKSEPTTAPNWVIPTTVEPTAPGMSDNWTSFDPVHIKEGTPEVG
jgi:hypothetical protein